MEKLEIAPVRTKGFMVALLRCQNENQAPYFLMSDKEILWINVSISCIRYLRVPKDMY